MTPPIPDDAVTAGAAALKPFGHLGSTFAIRDAQKVLDAAWPHMVDAVLRWAATQPGADKDWLRALAVSQQTE